jgi:hypothetical protein
MYYWIVSEDAIRNNWAAILLDRDNPRPDIQSADEWIALAKAGNLKMLGGTVVIQNELPKFGELNTDEDWIGIGNRGCFGVSSVFNPEYKAEQKRRNAVLLAALDYSKDPFGTRGFTKVDLTPRSVNLNADWMAATEEKPAAQTTDTIGTIIGDFMKVAADAVNRLSKEEKPIDIMAETRRMLG